MCKKNFSEIHSDIKSMMKDLTDAYAAFSVYEALKESRAPNVVGEDNANTNCDVLAKYNGFFVTTEKSHQFFIFMTLAKFFDECADTINLYRLKNDVSRNPDNTHNKSLVDTIRQIKKLLKNDQDIIRRLNLYRNKHLAHNLRKKSDVKITVGELQQIFETVDTILNTIAYAVKNESWGFGYIRKETKRDTEYLISDLKKL